MFIQVVADRNQKNLEHEAELSALVKIHQRNADYCFVLLYDIDQVNDLSLYMEKWGNPRRFRFAENEFDDIRVGSYPNWGKIARLGRGLARIYHGKKAFRYENDLRFKNGGPIYIGNIPGYLDTNSKNHQRTANNLYIDAIDHIAVIDLKKLGGGTRVWSDLSLLGLSYTEHAKQFEELLHEQIMLIHPTVMVFCGKEYGVSISHLIPNVVKSMGIPVLETAHPSRPSMKNKDFFEPPMRQYLEY